MNDSLPTELLDIEAQLLARGYNQKNHHTPTRFNADDSFVLMPHKRGAPLRSISQSIFATQAKATVVVLPLFLQLDPMVFWTHRAHHIPHAAAPAHQPQVIAALIEQLRPELVIATPATAKRIETALAAANRHASFALHIICNPHDVAETTTERVCYRDVHFIPGCSGAYQCTTLTKEPFLFHLSEKYDWHHEDGVHYATTKDPDEPFQLQNFPAFAGRVTQSTCPCGATSLLSLKPDA